MSAPGFWEIAALAVLALVIFGPDKLPGIAHSVGKTIAHFKREASSTLDELRAAAELEDMRGIAEDFKGVSADLKQSTDLRGAVAGAGAAGAAGRVRSEGRVPSGPPPFDPHAT